MLRAIKNPFLPLRAALTSRRACICPPYMNSHSFNPNINKSMFATSHLCRIYSSQTLSTDGFGKSPEYGNTYTFGPTFLSSFEESCRHAKVKTLSSEHLRLIAEEAASIQTQLSEPSDPIARTVNIEFTAYMVAAYRALKKSNLPIAEIRHLLEDAIRRAVQPASKFIRAGLDSSPDPFASVVGQSREKERDFYIAPDFDIQRVRDEPGSYHVKVNRCWYMNTLERLGAREIGRTFCTFDRAWYDCIDPKKHGFKFTRPTTIADGAESCAFNFDRN